MKVLAATVFILMCAAQWYVPGALIVEQEDVIKNGRVFRFRTEPIDPTDPFRGKYVTLRFHQEVLNLRGGGWETGKKMFAVLEEGVDGFAVVSDVVNSKPDNLDFMPVTVESGDSQGVRVRFPFDRFYLEESKASEAERLYWSSLSDTTKNVYALVRIKEGKTTLQDVMINDRSIVDIVRVTNRAD